MLVSFRKIFDPFILETRIVSTKNTCLELVYQIERRSIKLGRYIVSECFSTTFFVLFDS